MPLDFVEMLEIQREYIVHEWHMFELVKLFFYAVNTFRFFFLFLQIMYYFFMILEIHNQLYVMEG